MKKLLPIFMFLGLLLSQACEGPEGPAGPPGPAGTAGAPGATGPTGPAGASSMATTFEFQATFTAANQYFIAGGYPAGLTLGEGDGVFVYMLIDVVQTLPVWSPLVQTFFVSGKPISYNFAYSQQRLYVFVEAEAATYTAAGDPYLKDQVFRAIVIPGKKLRTDGTSQAKFNAKDYPVDFTNYQEVVKYFNLPEKNVPKVKIASQAGLPLNR